MCFTSGITTGMTPMPSQPAQCPFDHTIRRGTKVEQIDRHFHVACQDCGATGPERNTFAQALEAWNTRRKIDGDGDGHD